MPVVNSCRRLLCEQSRCEHHAVTESGVDATKRRPASLSATARRRHSMENTFLLQDMLPSEILSKQAKPQRSQYDDLIASTEALAKKLFGIRSPVPMEKRARQAANAAKWASVHEGRAVIAPRDARFSARSATDSDVDSQVLKFEDLLSSADDLLSSMMVAEVL